MTSVNEKQISLQPIRNLVTIIEKVDVTQFEEFQRHVWNSSNISLQNVLYRRMDSRW